MTRIWRPAYSPAARPTVCIFSEIDAFVTGSAVEVASEGRPAGPVTSKNSIPIRSAPPTLSERRCAAREGPYAGKTTGLAASAVTARFGVFRRLILGCAAWRIRDRRPDLRSRLKANEGRIWRGFRAEDVAPSFPAASLPGPAGRPGQAFHGVTAWSGGAGGGGSRQCARSVHRRDRKPGADCSSYPDIGDGGQGLVLPGWPGRRASRRGAMLPRVQHVLSRFQYFRRGCSRRASFGRPVLDRRGGTVAQAVADGSPPTSASPASSGRMEFGPRALAKPLDPVWRDVTAASTMAQRPARCVPSSCRFAPSLLAERADDASSSASTRRVIPRSS